MKRKNSRLTHIYPKQVLDDEQDDDSADQIKDHIEDDCSADSPNGYYWDETIIEGLRAER